MNTPYVSIVICTQNRAESLKHYCLPALTGLTYKNFEVVMVMDACSDNTLNILSSYLHKSPNLRIINNPKSRGLSYARNLGVRQAKGEIIAFIDDDCAVEPFWLANLIQPFLLDAYVMGVWGAVEQRTQTGTEEITAIGANMAFRRSVFDRFLFDTNLYYFNRSMCEEHDLGKRMQGHHFKFENADKARLIHFLMPTAYRKITALGYFINRTYMELKKNSLLRYYFFMFMGFYTALFFPAVYRSFTKRIYQAASLRDIAFVAPYYLFKLIIEKDIIKTIKLVYFLLLDIPIRAKIKNVFEELYFRTKA